MPSPPIKCSGKQHWYKYAGAEPAVGQHCICGERVYGLSGICTRCNRFLDDHNWNQAPGSYEYACKART